MSYKTNLREVQPKIRDYISSVIFNKDDASDVLQNTNEVLLNKEDKFNKDKPFAGWAIGVAKFQIRAYLTKSKRNKVDSVGCDTWIMDQVCEKIIEEKEKMESLNFIMTIDELLLDIKNKRLTNRERQVLHLTLKGYRIIDVAEKLQIKSSHASAYKWKAIKKIKQFIKENQPL